MTKLTKCMQNFEVGRRIKYRGIIEYLKLEKKKTEFSRFGGQGKYENLMKGVINK